MRARSVGGYPRGMAPTALSDPMRTTSWLVEHYWPGLPPELVRTALCQVRRTARTMARDGNTIRHRHSTLVPADEAAYSVIDATSRTLVEELYARAGVRFDRILTAEEI